MKKAILIFLVLMCSFVSAQDLTPEMGQAMLNDETLFVEHLTLIKNEYNSNLDSVPGIVNWIFGNERVIVHIEGKNPISLIMKDGEMINLGLGDVKDHTLDAYLSQDTVLKLLTGELSVTDALNQDLITYKAVKFTGKLKYGSLGWVVNFF